MKTKEVPLIPKYDLIFKQVFGSKKSKNVLEGMIREITGLPVKKILRIMNPYNIHEYRKAKEAHQRNKVIASAVDIKVELESGEIVIVEMQNAKQKTFLRRAQIYGATNFSDQYDGEYSTISAVYVILIMNYKHPFHLPGSN
ncbi:MAG: Rpn family recombination-promoting nuclease/putative transposase, partial [Lactobacillales bacterium]|nr:Rpn family recombination-promoting nuclease/putative transposase [Lactobacillales bacterium]